MLKISFKFPANPIPAKSPYEYLRLQVLAKTILVLQRKAKGLEATLEVFCTPYTGLTAYPSPLKSVVADPQEDPQTYLIQVWRACFAVASGFNFTPEQLDHMICNLSAKSNRHE